MCDVSLFLWYWPQRGRCIFEHVPPMASPRRVALCSVHSAAVIQLFLQSRVILRLAFETYFLRVILSVCCVPFFAT